MPSEKIISNIENVTPYERFFIPLIYERDEKWAEIMQNVVVNTVEYIQKYPQSSLDDVILFTINKMRPKLSKRVKSISNNPDDQHVKRLYAKNFGVPRENIRPAILVGDVGEYSAYKQEGIWALKKFGVYSETKEHYGRFSVKAGQSFVVKTCLLQHFYHISNERIELCRVESDWAPTHDDEYAKRPFSDIEITSPEARVIGPMLKEAGKIFHRINELKLKIDGRKVKKSANNLKLVTGRVAQIYWILSQTWPYKRGSAGIADLITKVIFDLCKIYTPVYKKTVNPNITALFNPLEEFKAKYNSFFTSSFRWLY